MREFNRWPIATFDHSLNFVSRNANGTRDFHVPNLPLPDPTSNGCWLYSQRLCGLTDREHFCHLLPFLCLSWRKNTERYALCSTYDICRGSCRRMFLLICQQHGRQILLQTRGWKENCSLRESCLFLVLICRRSAIHFCAISLR